MAMSIGFNDHNLSELRVSWPYYFQTTIPSYKLVTPLTRYRMREIYIYNIDI